MATDTNLVGDDKIGGFRFVRMLHPGATTTVMEVIQESTKKRFALKQLQAARSGDSAERKAFAFEARLGMQLIHPNLIRIHEYFRDPYQPYFIMDLFPSIHLGLPISRPSVYPMPTTQLHRILYQAASALSCMHEKGWIHRDVKPGNILVNKSGDVKVIDYALAMRPFSIVKKMLGSKAPRQGTPSYMSPEQIRCESPAPSCDIYSFGITCYEVVCGRPPFRGNSQNDLLNKQISERPAPLSAHNKDVTPEFNDLILSLIEKNPAKRMPSFEEFLLKFSKIRILKDDPPPTSRREQMM